MSKIKNTDEVKGLKPLTSDNPQPYDEIINQIREELGIPMNRSLLAKIATEDYIAKRTSSNGKVDLKAIAYPYARIKVAVEVEKLKAKLAEKEASIEDMKE